VSRRPVGLVALACGWTGVVLAGPAWPDIPEPPRAKVEIVARDIRVNGLLSRIDHFESELSVTEVLDFYRGRWSTAASKGTRETRSGDWRAVSTLHGAFQMVVQARPKSPHGSEGMLSVADFSQPQRDFIPAGWPRYDDMRITQVTESVDGPKRSQVVAMVSSAGFDVNLNRWRDEWRRRGFSLVHEQATPPKDGMRSWLGLYDKPPQALDITIVYRDADRRTYITANLVAPAQGTPR
jgi:hypothetical protein